MNMGTRTYSMTKRAESAQETGRRILDAAVALWREEPLDAFTLKGVADRAEVSVQTVIRRFGSKDGVIEAAIDARISGIEDERDAVAAGDIDGALDTLLAHYERDGDTVLRTLVLEDRLDAARRLAVHGRATHRAWCARVFAPWLSVPDHAVHLDAFVAATDLYLWKLLRRDLGRSITETRRVMRALLAGLTTTHP